MKKLVLYIVLLPIFLISTMNFFGGESDTNHHHEARAFTCSACHATIIDGIIIGGKLDPDGIMSQVDLTIPDTDMTSVVVNIGSEGDDADNNSTNLNTPEFVLADQYGELLSFVSTRGKGKKENTISIQHRITDQERANGFIEVQGVLSNLDGETTQDYSFYKKIALSTIIEQKELKLYPSIASTIVSIENTSASKSLKVFDVQGKMVLNTTTQENKTEIDLTKLQNGNYFAIIGQGSDVFQSRFIVSK